MRNRDGRRETRSKAGAPRAGRRARLAAILLAGTAVASLLTWLFVLPGTAPPPTAGAWAAVVTSVAGRGTPGFRDGAAALGAFSDPFAVSIGPDGSWYVADAGENNRVRRVTGDRIVTIAGGAGEGLRDGIRGQAAFHTPSGLAVAPDGTVYVADTGNHAIRRVDPDGRVRTIAGSGTPGYRDGDGAEAAFDGPVGIALGRDGTLYVADTYNDRIRRIDADGIVSTLAGAGTPGLVDGASSSVLFDTPTGVAVESDHTLLVADSNNHVVRRIDLRAGVVTTVIPMAVPGEDASLFRPVGIAVGAGGSAFVTDRRGRILQLFADASARTLAGSVPGFADGVGASARFFNPTGVAVDPEGALIVADAGNYVLRRLAPPGLYPPDMPRSPLAPEPGWSDRVTQALLPWPVDPQFEPHEVAGTMGEPRGSLGGDGRERFHAGVDIRADHGAVVRAVRSGKVDSPFAAQGYGTINESLSVGPLTYVHIRVGRDRGDRVLDPELFVPVPGETGEPVRIRVRRGARLRVSDVLGTVNRFNHVHLNAGPPGREVNPLLLRLPGFRDTIPPRIAARGITLSDASGQAFDDRSRGRIVVWGRVRIVVDAWDRADGNKPARRLGVFRLGYQVLDAAGAPLPGFERPRETMVFNRLPRDTDAARLVYADGSGITAYGNRRTRYRYTVTNWMRNGVATEDFWNAGELAPGDYTVRVLVADAAGNEALEGRDVRVTVIAAAPEEGGPGVS